MTTSYLFVLEAYTRMSYTAPIFIGTQQEFEAGMKEGQLAENVKRAVSLMLQFGGFVEALRREIHADGTVEFSSDDAWRSQCAMRHSYCWGDPPKS